MTSETVTSSILRICKENTDFIEFQHYYDYDYLCMAYVLLLPYHLSWSYHIYFPLKDEEYILRMLSGHTIADIVPGYVCNKNKIHETIL